MNFRCKKVFKGIVIICSFTIISACELIKQEYERVITPIPDSSLCVTKAQEDNFEDFCKVSHWFKYIVDIQPVAWSERMELITELDEETPSLVKKVLLSQGANTPFQHRLRAQNWIVKLRVEASDTMNMVLNELIFENSKQLLEFESAITILSRVNARQEKTITELELKLSARDQIMQTQQQVIQKQQDQVEQLLKIETDLSEQNRNEKR